MIIVFLFVLLGLMALMSIYMNKSRLITFVFLIYILMTLFSFILGVNDRYVLNSPEVQDGQLFFTLLIFLLLAPFLFFNQHSSLSSIKIPNAPTLAIINCIMIIGSFISVSYFLFIIYQVLALDDLSAFRHLLVAEGHPIIKPSLLNTLSGVIATFYPLTMFLFFVNLIRRGSKIVSVLLFIGTFSYPMFVFSYFGRDGFLFWFLSFVSLLYLFNDLINEKVIMRIRKVIIVFGSILFYLFIFITFIRFGDIGDSINSILLYLGQQPHVFAELYGFDLTPSSGKVSFSLITKPFMDDDIPLLFANELGSSFYLSWQFGTLVKEFYIDFGVIGGVIFLFFIGFVAVCFFFNGKRKDNMIKLFIFFAYSQVVIQGVFYFRQSNDVGNFYLLFLLFLLFIYRLIPCGNRVANRK